MDVEHVTKGVVAPANLAESVALGRTFDNVMCIEVAEHIPAEHTGIFLANLEALATKRVVLSWSPPLQAGVGHVNGKTEAEVVELLTMHTRSLEVDLELTGRVRAAAQIPYIAKSLLVLRKGAMRPKTGGKGEL